MEYSACVDNYMIGHVETIMVNGMPTHARFVSRSSMSRLLDWRRNLWARVDTKIRYENGNLYLMNSISNSSTKEDYTYHKKLKIHKLNSTSFYVNCKGVRCYCTNLIPRLMFELI